MPALVLATLASAILHGFAFPVVRYQPLAWIAAVPFLVAVRRAPSLKVALVLGWLWMTIMNLTVAHWLAGGIARYFAQPFVVGIGFFVGVSTFMTAIHHLAFTACYRSLARAPRSATPLLAAAAWVGAEFARVNTLTGNPWAVLGYSQIGVLPLMQIAELSGVYGMSFVLAAVNAALAEVWLARRDGALAVRDAMRGAIVTAVVVVVVVGYGMIRLQATSIVSDAPPVKVALVQGNVDVGQQWREEFYGRNLDSYLQLTRAVVAEDPPPAVVFWPENALTFFLEDEPLYRAAIGRVLAPSGAELVTGGPRTARTARPTYYASVFVVSPDGAIVGTYDKQKLLPFGEYFPFSAVDLLRQRFARVHEFTPGSSSSPLMTAAGPAGVTICNEAMFPEIAAARVRAGATYLVDPANDTWLTPAFSAQQFDIVTLRSVEQRRYLVRASTSGPSAIVDPFGRVVQRTEFFTQTAITGEIRPGTTITWYCRVGDLFAWLCVLVASLAWLVYARREKTPPHVVESEAA